MYGFMGYILYFDRGYNLEYNIHTQGMVVGALNFGFSWVGTVWSSGN